MAGIKNSTLCAKNADYTQVDGPNAQSSENNGLVTNGKMWIGSTALNVGGTHINVGTLTSPNSTISFGYSSPNITVDVIDKNVAPIGSLQYFSTGGSDTTYPGSQWLPCDGSVLSQATYATLFSRVGLLNGAGTVWTKGAITLPDISFTSVSYGNSTYVRNSNALANFITTSTDGITWTSRTTGVNSVMGVGIFGGGLFVSAGNGGALATSTDGITWTGQTSGTNQAITSMAYNGTRYAFSWNNTAGLVSSSTDAVTWTQYPVPISQMVFIRMASNGSSFAATTTNWFSVTSTDGITWSSKTPTNSTAQSGSGTRSIVFGGGQYVCCSSNPAVCNSADGVNWTARTTGATTLVFNNVIYGGNYVVGGNAGIVYSSTDAVTWTVRTSNTSSSIMALGFGASTYVYGTVAGGGGTSTDGTTWVAHNTGSASQVRSITYGTVFAYGFTGGGISTSTDGITFTARTSGTASAIQCINYLNGQYVYAGTGGVLSTSTDAITWNAQTSGTTTDILSMAYGTNYVYCGAAGILASSTDAVTWTRRFAGKSATIDFDSIIWDGSKYIMGQKATTTAGFLTSTDAITWTSYNPPATSAGNPGLFSTLFYGSQFIAGAASAQIFTSTDLFTWTYRPGLTSFMASCNSIISTGGKYFAVGTANTSTAQPSMTVAYAGSSTDGNTWYPVSIGNVADSYNALVYGDKFVAVGNLGVTMTASGTYSYNSSTSFQLPVDNIQRLNYENQDNFKKTLYIRAT